MKTIIELQFNEINDVSGGDPCWCVCQCSGYSFEININGRNDTLCQVVCEDRMCGGSIVGCESDEYRWLVVGGVSFVAVIGVFVGFIGAVIGVTYGIEKAYEKFKSNSDYTKI